MNTVITYKNISFDVTAEYVDTSFEHAFGVKRQGHYELTSCRIGDAELIELLSDEVLDKIEEII